MTDYSELSREVEPATASDDIMRVVLKAEAHHQHIRDQLELVVASRDKGIRIGEGEDALVLEAGTEKWRGFRAGIQIALHFIGEFPIKVKETERLVGSYDDE